MEVGEGEPSNTCRELQRRSYAMSVSSQREGGVRVTVCVFGVRRWRGKGGGRGRLGIVCIFRQIPGFQKATWIHRRGVIRYTMFHVVS